MLTKIQVIDTLKQMPENFSIDQNCNFNWSTPTFSRQLSLIAKTVANKLLSIKQQAPAIISTCAGTDDEPAN